MNLRTGLFMALGLLAGTTQAATLPANAPVVGNGSVIQGAVTYNSWLDPNEPAKCGWTHKSQWARIRLVTGQTATITVTSADASLHPGLTVWYRPGNVKGNTGSGINYVPDHVYNQVTDFTAMNATDEDTGKKLGTIVMKYVANGYDADSNNPAINVQQDQKAGLVGLVDGVPGQLKLQFTAARTGWYEFVYGGLNPWPADLAGQSITQTVSVSVGKPY